MYNPCMEWLNYHHLLYFWTVAKEGSIAAACKELRLAQPTVSGQIRTLEASLGHKLFERAGRGLVMTEIGRTVFRYAEDIFSLGDELIDTLKGRTTGKQMRVRVGVADVLPKLVVYRMLMPVLSLAGPLRVVCYEGKPAELFARLIVHELDVVLSDSPAPPYSTGGSGGPGASAYNHRLGDSGLAVFGTASLASRYRRGFPASLTSAPMLLPTPNTVLRRTLDHWFGSHGIRPVVCGEFEDSALLKAFGQSGAGLFVAHSLIESEIKAQHDVRLVGRLSGVKEQFYAISMERRIKHPAVAVLTDTARKSLSAKG